MRIFLIVLILIHGLIHLLGFLKAYNLANIDQLTQNISKPVGLLWLAATVLFLLACVLLLMNNESWWIPGGTAVIISQILIVLSWSDAKFGTIANVILILPILMAYENSQPTSYRNLFRAEVEKGLKRSVASSILTENDIAHLPANVQKYLHYVGAVGKERVWNFKIVSNGEIKTKPDSDFLDFTAVQYNFVDEPTRAFYIESKMFGLPFDGLHLYVGPSATMQIKVAQLFQVVDAKGPEMNKGETVTMFNDMCFFAPATLIDKNIEWELIDSLKLKAKFTNQGNTITAILFFNEIGELINFSSMDRYLSSDGKEYKSYEWTTPVRNYKEISGRKVPAYGEATWHMPKGEFCYGKFNIVAIDYNCKKFE